MIDGPREQLLAALDAYTAADPADVMTNWAADLVADVFAVARHRDPEFSFFDYGIALGMAAGYAGDPQFK